MAARAGAGASGDGGRVPGPGSGPERKTGWARAKENLGCAGLATLMIGAPACLALMDWRPLLLFPVVVLGQWLFEVVGPVLRGRHGLKRSAMVVGWILGTVAAAAVVGFGVNLLGQTEPDCVPSETVRCNVLIDGRVVGEADASDADSERVQNVFIAIAVMTLGGIPLGMLLWNGYQAVRRHRRV